MQLKIVCLVYLEEYSPLTQVDAYVLSESSMFISKRRFILKTCGTTTPLDCIEHLTRLVTEHAKFDTVEVGRNYEVFFR